MSTRAKLSRGVYTVLMTTTPQTAAELAETFTLDELRTIFDAMPLEAMLDKQPRSFEANGIEGFATMSDVGQAKLIHRGWVR